MNGMRLTSVLPCLLLLVGCGEKQSSVVLYCAQDEPFARTIFADFEQSRGISVQPKFDTEADKSVSLFIEIVQERERPRCDVFWNNEILSTIRLQKQGLLESYDSPAAEPFPDWAKAKDHTWHAFAERARVLIIHKKQLAGMKPPTGLLDLTHPRWKGKVVMAQPHHGTAATQAAVLFAVLGPERAKKYYLDLLANEVRLAPGNRQVAEWVARGRTPSGEPVAIGITDTDDAMLALDDSVEILVPNDPEGTLFIPNTVAIIKGCRHPEEARKLVDFLLRPETEAKLSQGPSRQLPLNPNVEAELPEPLRPLRRAKRMKVDFHEAAARWDEVQTFLRRHFARPR